MVKPLLGQGYLILDKANNPEVEIWQIDILKRTFDDFGKFKDEIIEKNKLPNNINYLFIPVEYRKMDYPIYYTINVTGFDAGGNILVTENNIYLNNKNHVNDDLIEANGGVPYVETDCRKTCIGSTYAYHIQQYKKLTADLTRLRLDHAYKAFDIAAQTVNPYWWYSYTDEGYSVTNPSFQTPGFWSGSPAPITVYGIGGSPLLGLVYGYQKTLGDWEGNKDIETDGNLTIGLEFCSESLYTAMSLMNAYADFTQAGGFPTRPPLVCVPVNTGSGGGYIPTGNPTPTDTSIGVTFIYCYLTGIYGPCENVVNPNMPDLMNSLQSMGYIFITDLNDNTQPVISVNTADLFDENGGFNGLNITLPPSLYSFGFMFKEVGYWTKIGDLRTTTTLTLDESDMLDITIFPVPITDKTFSVKMVAQATLTFDYEIRDSMGNLVMTSNITIKKGHEKTQIIKNTDIPNGNLFHRFVFKDGSVKTLQTLQN